MSDLTLRIKTFDSSYMYKKILLLGLKKKSESSAPRAEIKEAHHIQNRM